MKIKDLARTRLGVAPIGEAGDDASAFVQEWQRLFVVDPFQLSGGVTFSLFFDLGNFMAEVLLLGFDYTDGFFIHKQHVICRTHIGLIFAHRLS